MGDTTSTERWTCAGVRVGSKGKRAVAWLDPTDNKTYLYAERARYVLGGSYDVPVTRSEGRVLRGKPTYAGFDDVGADVLREWRVADMASEQELAREARERKDSKAGNDSLDEALQPLLAYSKSCRTTAQRNALVADVILRLTTPWHRG